VRSTVALAVAAIVAMLFQTTLFPAVPGLPLVPDLILVLVVYLAVRHQTVGSACGAFLLGYFVDTFSGTTLGVNAVALTAVYTGVHLIARHLWLERGAPLMVIVFFACVARDLVTVAAATLVAPHAPLWQHVVSSGLLSAVIAALAAPSVFAAVAWEKRLLGVA